MDWFIHSHRYFLHIQDKMLQNNKHLAAFISKCNDLKTFEIVMDNGEAAIQAAATKLGGIGIDCPDIERVIHWELPTTLEQYI